MSLPTDDVTSSQKAKARLGYWAEAYLQSMRYSYDRGRDFCKREDFFSGYLYLFVAFNNMYSVLARSTGTEPDKIRSTVGRVPDAEIERFYNHGYVEMIRFLNDTPPEQFRVGPDATTNEHGILNMQKYFQGKPAAECVKHLTTVADPFAALSEKRATLTEVAASLLYTIRNNQFHAVKGAQRLSDQLTLREAFAVLEPIVDALIVPFEEHVSRAASNPMTALP